MSNKVKYLKYTKPELIEALLSHEEKDREHEEIVSDNTKLKDINKSFSDELTRIQDLHLELRHEHQSARAQIRDLKDELVRKDLELSAQSMMTEKLLRPFTDEGFTHREKRYMANLLIRKVQADIKSKLSEIKLDTQTDGELPF